jgi:putative hydrolase of the HAD superfamily
LFKITVANLNLYGYGAKSFVLSMIETALKISNIKLEAHKIEAILKLGRDILEHPLLLLDDVENVLDRLQRSYRLIVATKGDLLEQETKLKKSGLEKYFHHIEIMSEKDVLNYKKLIKHLDTKPEEFVMIGNSMKSDILPVLETGGYAIYIPCADTWVHENAHNHHPQHPRFKEIERFSRLTEIL